MASYNRLSTSDSPLLDEDEKDLEQTSGRYHRGLHYEKQSSRWWQHWSLRLLLFTAYSIALVSLAGFWKYRIPVPFLTYTPAEEAAKFHKVQYDGTLGKSTLYTGAPRPEGEEAWSRLFKNYNLRFTAEELRKLNRTALELRNGGGYYGQLSAYHHLHCLKMLRQLVWHDAYNVSIAEMRGHADHCIDDIRQSLMCHADLSVVTFYWRDDKRKPWPNFHIDQTCVDWDALDAWAAKRSFSIFDQKTLVHPKHGISFPIIDGKIEIHEHKHDGGHEVQPVWPQEDHSDHSGHSHHNGHIWHSGRVSP